MENPLEDSEIKLNFVVCTTAKICMTVKAGDCSYCYCYSCQKDVAGSRLLLLLLLQLSEGCCRQETALTVTATAVRRMLQEVDCCYCYCYSCQGDVAGSRLLLLLLLQLSEGCCRK
jgi:hypothetical protein